MGHQGEGRFMRLKCYAPKQDAVTVSATTFPQLNIFFCDPLPRSSADGDGAVSSLGRLLHGTQAVCSLQLHQFPEGRSNEVCFVGVFLTGDGKLSLAVKGQNWAQSGSITLPSPETNESPGGSGSSLTLTFPSVRKFSCLA